MSRCWSVLVAIGVTVLVLGAAGGGLRATAAGRSHETRDGGPSRAQPGAIQPHGHQHGTAHEHGEHDHHHGDAAGDTRGHPHAPVPPEYKSAHLPASAWTNTRLIARGRQIYAERCAVCHGDSGDGNGPASTALSLKPPDLRDVTMVDEMTGNYWFWRVSEGGAVDPFKSAGSVMPAWKDELSVEDRWAVIVYQHTFSGHEGPHVTSEHPQSVMASPAGHGIDRSPAGRTAGDGPPTSPSHHRH